MRFATTIDISCDKPAELEKTLQGEIGSHSSERSQMSLMIRKGSIIINIEADDVTALRAAFNSVTKLISVHQEMEKIR